MTGPAGGTGETTARPWPTHVHEQTEWEVAAAYEMGLRDGICLAAATINDRVLAALARPRGHGGPDLDLETRDTMIDLYQRYLGVGIRPDRR
jgi:hypothetical protein